MDIQNPFTSPEHKRLVTDFQSQLIDDAWNAADFLNRMSELQVKPRPRPAKRRSVLGTIAQNWQILVTRITREPEPVSTTSPESDTDVPTIIEGEVVNQPSSRPDETVTPHSQKGAPGHE